MVIAQRVADSLSLECVKLTGELVSPKEFLLLLFLIEILLISVCVLPISICADMSFEGFRMS